MRRRLLAVMLVGVSLLAAACGGDDEKGAADAGNVQTANTTDGADSSRDAGSDGGVGAAGVFSSAECVRAVQAMGAAVSAAGLAISGQTDEIEKTTREFAEFAKKAPADIRDDLETLSDAYGEYGRIVRESGWKPASGTPPPQSVIDDLEEASKSLQSSEVSEAQGRLQAWFQEQCPR